MRLLSKSDVALAKAKDRQAEMQEGMKLAKRVDTLREISTQEEAALHKFRRETLEQVSEEISQKVDQRNALADEVKALEERKAIALAPLDKEWKEIEEARTHFIEAGADLLNRAHTLQTKEASLDTREKELISKETQVENKYTYASQLLIDADTLKKEAERQKQQIEKVLADAERQSAEKIANTERRERFSQEREKAVFNKEEELRIKEIDLAKNWSLLKDREAVLARNLKRIEK